MPFVLPKGLGSTLAAQAHYLTNHYPDIAGSLANQLGLAADATPDAWVAAVEGMEPAAVIAAFDGITKLAGDDSKKISAVGRMGRLFIGPLKTAFPDAVAKPVATVPRVEVPIAAGPRGEGSETEAAKGDIPDGPTPITMPTGPIDFTGVDPRIIAKLNAAGEIEVLPQNIFCPANVLAAMQRGGMTFRGYADMIVKKDEKFAFLRSLMQQALKKLDYFPEKKVLEKIYIRVLNTKFCFPLWDVIARMEDLNTISPVHGAKAVRADSEEGLLRLTIPDVMKSRSAYLNPDDEFSDQITFFLTYFEQSVPYGTEWNVEDLKEKLAGRRPGYVILKSPAAIVRETRDPNCPPDKWRCYCLPDFNAPIWQMNRHRLDAILRAVIAIHEKPQHRNLIAGAGILPWILPDAIKAHFTGALDEAPSFRWQKQINDHIDKMNEATRESLIDECLKALDQMPDFTPHDKSFACNLWPNGFDEIVEIVSRAIAPLENSEAGDGLLVRVFTKYRASENRNLVCLFRELYPRHQGRSVRDVARQSPLFPYFGYGLHYYPEDGVEEKEFIIDASSLVDTFKPSAHSIMQAVFHLGVAGADVYDDFINPEAAKRVVIKSQGASKKFEARTWNLREVYGEFTRKVNAQISFTNTNPSRAKPMTDAELHSTVLDDHFKMYLRRFVFAPKGTSLDFIKFNAALEKCFGRNYLLDPISLQRYLVLLGSPAFSCNTVSGLASKAQKNLPAFVVAVNRLRGETRNLDICLSAKSHRERIEICHAIIKKYAVKEFENAGSEVKSWKQADREQLHFFELSAGQYAVGSMLDVVKTMNDALKEEYGEAHGYWRDMAAIGEFYPLEFYTDPSYRRKLARKLFEEAVARGEVDFTLVVVHDLILRRSIHHHDAILRKQELEFNGNKTAVIYSYYTLLRSLDVDGEDRDLFKESKKNQRGGNQEQELDGPDLQAIDPRSLDFKSTLEILSAILPLAVPTEKIHEADWYKVIQDDGRIVFKGRVTSLKALIQRFREHLALNKMGLKDFVGNNYTGQSKELVPVPELIDQLKFYIYNYQDIAKMSDAQVLDLLDREKLEELLFSIGDSAHDLAEYLQSFRQDLVARYGLQGMVRRFEGLAVAHGSEARALRVSSPEREEAYTRAVLARLAHLESIDEAAIESLKWTYRRMLRRWFAENPDACLDWLDQRHKALSDLRLKNIFEQLYYSFFEDSEFSLPSTLRVKMPGSALPHEDELEPFQVEAIRKFSGDECKRGLLADEQGLGKTLQAIGVAECSGARKVLWVTTAGNLQSVRSEILRFTTHDASDVAVIGGGNGSTRNNLRNLDGKKYCIVNYEMLRSLEENDPEGYALLMKDIDLAIIDESQLADNTESQQGAAVQKIKAERMLLLSATPYQQKIERLWSTFRLLDPERFHEDGEEVFRQEYTRRGQEGLIDLHHLLQKYMLYRTKDDVRGTVDPEKPLAEQRKKLPRKIEVPTENAGGFYMSREQAELYIRILSDFPGFCDEYYMHLDEDKRNKKKKSSFAKLDHLFDVLYKPDKYGLSGPNRRLEETKERIRKHLREGKKILLWADNKDAVEDLKKAVGELEAEFPGLSYGLFDGSGDRADVSYLNSKTGATEKIAARDYDRIRFQDPHSIEPRILICSVKAASVGLTLTAASVAINYQVPMMFTTYLQLMDRNHRLDRTYHRDKVFYERLMARIPPDVLESVDDADLRAILAKGTVDEVLFARLRDMIGQFRLVKEGLLSEEEIKGQIQKDMFEAVSFKISNQGKGKKVIFNKGRAARIAERGEAMAAAHAALRMQGENERAEAIVRIMTYYGKGALSLADMEETLDKLGEGESAIKALHATLSLSKSYYMKRFLGQAMPFFADAIVQGRTVSDVIDAHFADVIEGSGVPLQIQALIMPLIIMARGDASRARRIFDQLRSIKNQALAIQYAGKLFVALTHVTQVMHKNPSFDVASLFDAEAWEQSENAETLIDSFYLACQILGSAGGYTNFAIFHNHPQKNNPQDFHEYLVAIAWERVKQLSDLKVVGKLREVFTSPHRLLAVVNGFKAEEKSTLRNSERWKRLLKILAEIGVSGYRKFLASFSEDFVKSIGYDELNSSQDAWRENPKAYPYQRMMEEYAEPITTRYESIKINAQMHERSRLELQQSQKEIRQNLASYLNACENGSAVAVIKYYLSLAKDGERAEVSRALAKIKKMGLAAIDETMQVFVKHMGLADDVRDDEVRDIAAAALNWFAIIGAVKKGEASLQVQARIAELINRYEVKEDAAPVMELLETLMRQTNSVTEEKSAELKDVVITDTDDPETLLSIGEFHPAISNCLATDGAPWYIETVPHRLGSPTTRAITVDVAGKRAAVAVMKIRLDKNRRPVFYLEIIVVPGLYDFRDEIVAHMIEKARNSRGFIPRVAVMVRHAYGLAGEVEDVRGLGGYGNREFEEALMHFGPRDSATMRHKAKIVYDPTTGSDLKPALQGESAQKKLEDAGIYTVRRRNNLAQLNVATAVGALATGAGHVVG